MAHMYSSVFRRLALGIACALVLFLAPTALAAVKADVRVVTANGKTLTERTVRTGGVDVKTDPEADCFGEGTGGSGEKVRVPGPTALGIVVDAAAFDRDLRPISVTDAFDFGLGVCGFGGYDAPKTGFWYLKRNHVAAEVGGDQLKLKDGDEVLWYLDRDFSDDPPGELRLKAPARAMPGEPVEVKVLVYSPKGKKAPAQGARVQGASGPTDRNGETTVSFDSEERDAALQAERRGDIPSNTAHVCVSAVPSQC